MKFDVKKFIICLLGGWFGLHRFLEGNMVAGVVYLCTFGLFGIGWILDLVKIVNGTYTQVEKKSKTEVINQNFENKNSFNNTTNEQITNKKIYAKRVTEFSNRLDEYRLKWKYLDVPVAGTQNIQIDYTKLQIGTKVSFEKEPNNEYDSNAIKIKQNDIFLGYVHKGTIQEMLHSYLENDKYYVFAKLNLIDEENRKLQIQIAFYEIFDESKCTLVKKFNTSLTKTSKKAEEYESSRQDNLGCLSEGEYLEIEEQYDSDGYLVLNDVGEELGELSASVSEKLSEYYENGYEIIIQVTEITENDSGKYGAKVEIKVFE